MNRIVCSLHIEYIAIEFYLPNGERASGNGALITALAQCAHNVGRGIASPQEAMALLGLG